MNGVNLYFVNKLFLVGRYWDFKKKSMVTLANEVWQMGPNTSSLFHPILLSRDQPFSNRLDFPKEDLFGEHNLSKTALVYCLQMPSA